MFFGLAYGHNLVAGLQQSEHLAGPGDYALAYIGFGAPYLIDALNLAAGREGALVIVGCAAVVLAAWTAGYSRRAQPVSRCQDTVRVGVRSWR